MKLKVNSTISIPMFPYNVIIKKIQYNYLFVSECYSSNAKAIYKIDIDLIT